MRRAPLAVIALFFVSGIIAGHAYAHPVDLFFLMLALCCAFLVAVPVIWISRKRRHLSLAPLLLFCLLNSAVFGAGYLNLVSTHVYPVNHVSVLDEVAAEHIILGEIQTTPATTPYAHRFVIDAKRVYIQDTIKTVTGLVQVHLKQSDSHLLFDKLSPGQTVLLRGLLEKPGPQRNPGAFDYRTYLSRKGITRILDAEDAHVLSPGKSFTSRTLRFRYAFQQTIQASIDNHIERTEARSILYALILGNQSDISQSAKQNFQQTGLTHLLAVSGLHVMLVGFIVYHLLLPFCLRLGFSWRQTELVRAVITIVILGIYMAITDFKAPVVRAAVMAFLMIAGAIFQRPSSSINTLGAAALLLLIHQPTQLFNVGFQLSFAAVLSILLLVTPLTSFIPQSWMKHFMVRFSLQSMLVSASATLGTLPILVYHFGFISFAGILLNIVALPLTAAALGAGLLMVLSALLSPFLAAALGNTTESLITLLITTAEYGSTTLSFMQVEPGDVSLATFTLLVFAATFLAVYQFPRFRWKYVAISFVIILLFNTKEIANTGAELSIVFFDVGHGDASLVQFPNGSTLLIDAGNKNQFTDQARQVILPFLNQKGISTLDALLVTHPHLDHMGGLETLLASVSVNQLIGGDAAMIKRFNHVTKFLPDSTTITQVSAGDTLTLDPSVRIRILSPPSSLVNHHNPNERSVVLQIQYGYTHFLFLGDAETVAEQTMISNFPAFLHSDVVKVAHHGSRTSSGHNLINATSDQNKSNTIAVISVGASSGYGLPDEEVIERWQANESEIHITAASGALWIKSDGRQVWTVTF